MLRRRIPWRRAVLLFALAVACGAPEGAAPAPGEEPPSETAIGPSPGHRTAVAAERSTPPADPPPAPEPARGEAATSPADGALATYRALTDAFGQGDRDGYLGHYADRLRCFFGRRDHPRDAVARAREQALARNARGTLRDRIRSIETRVVRASADEVELADFGWTGPGASVATTFHQKRIVLARRGDAWRVVVETALSDRACGLAPIDARPPRLWRYMRDAHAALIESCEGPPGSTLDDGYPGIGGSIGCDARMAMQGAEELCLELPDAAREACFRHARAEVEAYAGGS